MSFFSSEDVAVAYIWLSSVAPPMTPRRRTALARRAGSFSVLAAERTRARSPDTMNEFRICLRSAVSVVEL